MNMKLNSAKEGVNNRERESLKYHVLTLDKLKAERHELTQSHVMNSSNERK